MNLMGWLQPTAGLSGAPQISSGHSKAKEARGRVLSDLLTPELPAWSPQGYLRHQLSGVLENALVLLGHFLQ